MVRTLERKFKKLLSTVLRFFVGSRPALIDPKSEFNRILVIRQHNQLGDMLCVVPLLRALRKRYPDAYIALMTSPVNYDVMLNNQYLNKIINYNKDEFLGRGLRGWRNLFRFVKTLRAEQFQLAIVPATVSMSFTSDALAYLSGAPARIGPAALNGKQNASAFFYNYSVRLDWRDSPRRHQTLRNLDVATILGALCDDLSLEMTLSEEELLFARELQRTKSSSGKQIIVYHPGAGKVANRWESRNFAAVANVLSREANSSVFITVGPMDEEPALLMMRSLECSYNIVSGKPIREVAVLLSVADLVITNDTGIMHVAAAVGARVLSLFGPTDPEQWAPLGVRNRYLRGDRGNIDAISVVEVLQNANEMLDAF